MNEDNTVDIVIPLYNEEKVLVRSVETLIDFLESSCFPYRYRITLANNASTDRSWTICTELAKRFSNVHALDVGAKGKGLAIRTAWSKSQADLVVFMDADLATDLAFLKALVDPVAQGMCQLSVGNRLGPDSKILDRHFHREILSRIFNLLVRHVLGSTLSDHQCGFKAMKRDAFLRLQPEFHEDGFLFDTELIVVSLKSGLKIRSIDITWRDGKDSKMSVLSDSFKMFFGIFQLRKRL